MKAEVSVLERRGSSDDDNVKLTSLTARSGIGLAVDRMPKARQSMAIQFENCIVAVVRYCEIKIFLCVFDFEVGVDEGKDRLRLWGLYILSFGVVWARRASQQFEFRGLLPHTE